MTLTRPMIDAGRRAGGAWNRRQLALLGVTWPPERGWPARIIGTEISQTAYETFLAAKSKPVIRPDTFQQPEIKESDWKMADDLAGLDDTERRGTVGRNHVSDTTEEESLEARSRRLQRDPAATEEQKQGAWDAWIKEFSASKG